MYVYVYTDISQNNSHHLIKQKTTDNFLITNKKSPATTITNKKKITCLSVF